MSDPRNPEAILVPETGADCAPDPVLDGVVEGTAGADLIDAAYTSDFQTVTSSSNEQINPAVQVQATLNGQVVAEGWVFQNLPEFNSFKSEQVKVRLISAERTQKK